MPHRLTSRKLRPFIPVDKPRSSAEEDRAIIASLSPFQGTAKFFTRSSCDSRLNILVIWFSLRLQKVPILNTGLPHSFIDRAIQAKLLQSKPHRTSFVGKYRFTNYYLTASLSQLSVQSQPDSTTRRVHHDPSSLKRLYNTFLFCTVKMIRKTSYLRFSCFTAKSFSGFTLLLGARGPGFDRRFSSSSS